MIVQKIRDAIKELVDTEDVHIEHPTDISHGDYSTNVALILSKESGENPHEFASSLVEKLNKRKIEGVESIEVAGPGFINFHLSQKFFQEAIQEILDKKDKYGNSDKGKNKKVIVEYSSPNIAKPFTVGHLRSTIIGDAIANLMESQGYEVTRDNHIGDWGTQFGKLITAFKRWGDKRTIATHENPVKPLAKLYVKFHKEAENDTSLEDEARSWFSKLESGDKEAREIWQQVVKWSMKEFDGIYKRLGVSFDTMHGESFFEDKMESVIEDVKKANIAKESEGAYLIFFPKEKYPPLMILKKDGSTLYATRDLATDKYRRDKYGHDVLIINEVGREQSLYFQQLFEAEETLGYFPKSNRVHVAHGHFRFQDGKMSTRKGNVIWLEDILNEAVKRASAFNPDTAEEVGIGAVKYNDLKREAAKDILFKWDDVLNLEGNSGPYIQYAHARAVSILKKSGKKKSVKEPEEAGVLEKLIYRFPEITQYAATSYAPHHICTYLNEVAQAFNTYYAKNPILNIPYRLALTEAVAIVLKNGLRLLSITAPDKM